MRVMHPMMDEFENVEQMPLWHSVCEQIAELV